MSSQEQYQIDCIHFNGYKPCSKNSECHSQCPQKRRVKESILVVHLGAMGAVLRSTSLLRALQRKHPECMITWITEENTKPLLENNPLIHRILTLSARDQLILSGMEFDVGYFIDKSPEIGGIANQTQIKKILGFITDKKTGAILPSNPAARELWEIGLNNQKKFYENKKSEQQLVAEALELPYQREEYLYFFCEHEIALIKERKKEWSQGKKLLLGLNTGTSGFLPQKTIPNIFWQKLINKIENTPLLNQSINIVLLGGGSIDERNHQLIAKNSHCIISPSTLGLRDGFCSVAAMDLVVSGDSLGMHMAIACQKPVIAWFGPSCAHEIDLYGRGVKIKSNFSCSPCWKRQCHQQNMCNEHIEENRIMSEIHRHIDLIRANERSKITSHSEAANVLF